MRAWLAGRRHFWAGGRIGVGGGGWELFREREVTCEHFWTKLLLLLFFFCSEIKCVCTLAERNCDGPFSGHRLSGFAYRPAVWLKEPPAEPLLLARDLRVCRPARCPSQVVAHFSPIVSRFARLQPSPIMESTAFAGPRFLFAAAMD